MSTKASGASAIVVASGGCTTAKVKVAEPGQSVDDEIERLEAVRTRSPWADASASSNCGWDVDTAVARLGALERAGGGLEYVEQPSPTVADLAACAAAPVPVADESTRRAADPHEVKRLDAADVNVLKVHGSACGRARPRCRHRAAGRRGPPRSSCLPVGSAQGIALAAALPELPYACGLATAHLHGRHGVV